MKDKMLFLILIAFLSKSLSYSNHLFTPSQSLLNAINDNKASNFSLLQKLTEIFNNVYPLCGKDIEYLDPKTYGRKITSNYPKLLGHVGFTINDIEDEIECVSSLDKTFYLIALIKAEDFINSDDEKLVKFLNYTSFCVGGCATIDCQKPLIGLVNLFAGFTNTNTGEEKNSEDRAEFIIASEDEKNPNILYIVLIWIFIVYISIKVFVGFVRLIKIPKGYEIYVSSLLNKNNNKNEQNLIFDENNEILENRPQDDKIEDKDLNTEEYNPKFDLTLFYPKFLRIWRFFDFFNDFSLLSTRRNRYFNDYGLESINFLRVIVLYLFIFSNIFNSLMEMPSKDILNKSFFSSKLMFFFRFSINASACWIFFEATYTSYKFMKFFKANMDEYNKENKSKNYHINLLIIFGKFVFLFIPKICMFLFCYYFFYNNIKKFKGWFDAPTTFKYVVEKVITKDKTCGIDNKNIFFIFSIIFNFDYKISNYNKCYDFTFIYINIFICILIFMISLYLIFLIQRKIVDIFFIVFYLVFFFGLIFLVEDKYIDYYDENNEKNIYRYYHFRGNDYIIKIVYLSIGVYNLGFILGILCFNYNNIKNQGKKKKKIIYKLKERNQNTIYEKKLHNKKEISFNINDSGSTDKDNQNNNINNNMVFEKKQYYPLTFLNYLLIKIHNMKSGIKIVIILLCFSLQILLSFFFIIYGIAIKGKKKKENEEKKGSYKYDRNFERNYILEMDFGWILKGYFLFEKHVFLILLFFISLILMTFPERGLFYKLISSKMITLISRVGFTIICICYILTYFSFCGFLIKIKFRIFSFIIISIGIYLIILVVSILLNIAFELPIRMFIKKILRIKIAQKDLEERAKSISTLISI